MKPEETFAECDARIKQEMRREDIEERPIDSVTCPHENFHADMKCIRIEDRGEFVAEISVRCVQCDTAFRFTGLPTMITTQQPCVSTFGDTASLPMMPGRRTIDEVPRSIPVHFAPPIGGDRPLKTDMGSDWCEHDFDEGIR